MTTCIAQCINSAMTDTMLLIGEYYLVRFAGRVYGLPYFKVNSLPDEILLEENFLWADSSYIVNVNVTDPNEGYLGEYPGHRFHFLRERSEILKAIHMRKSRAEFTEKGIPGAHSES